VSELLAGIYERIGRLYAAELNLPATPEMKVLFPRHLNKVHVAELAGAPVVELLTFDGFKFVLANDQWVLLRFSGTEPLLRLQAEADSPERAQALLTAAKKLLAM
jgi:phosphomannomutase